MAEKILRIFSAIQPLSEKERDDFAGITKEVQVEKGDYWIRENVSNNNIAWLEKGYLRKYFLLDGNEKTDSFYFENDFCADLPSIIGGHTPTSNIIAMEPTTLIVFSYVAFNKLCSQSPAIEHIYRVMIEQNFLRFYRRTTSFILQTTKERYENLVREEPQVLQRANQYHIASYIGTSYQHLSRLRAEK